MRFVAQLFKFSQRWMSKIHGFTLKCWIHKLFLALWCDLIIECSDLMPFRRRFVRRILKANFWEKTILICHFMACNLFYTIESFQLTKFSKISLKRLQNTYFLRKNFLKDRNFMSNLNISIIFKKVSWNGFENYKL